MSKKYAQFNDDGFPVAFYDDAINHIPTGVVKLSQEQYLELVNNQGRVRWNGSAVVEYTSPFNADACAAQIKAIAGEVILAIAPEYKQRNMLAFSVEVADAKAQGTATYEQIAQSEAIRLVWARIQAVRAKSNELEEQYISAGEDLTAEDIEAIRVELETAGE